MIRRFPFRGLSIQQRLPLLICVLLLSVVVTFSLISYIGVKNASLKSGKERLQSLSSQLSSMFSQQFQRVITSTRTEATQEPIKKILQTSGSEFQTQAMQILQKMRPDSTWLLAE